MDKPEIPPADGDVVRVAWTFNRSVRGYKIRLHWRWARRYLWRPVQALLWKASDALAPYLWQLPVKYVVLRCPNCSGPIEKKREVYIMDNPLSHYYCRSCSLNIFFNLETHLPRAVSDKLIKKYYERNPELKNPLDN